MSRIEQIKFETYREEFLEQQVELVTKASKGWELNYPNAEALKQTYSDENFSPDTRHYAFEGDTLVGFIASAVENEEEKRASIQYPFVRGDDPELQKMLVKKAFHTLKEKGAEFVVSNVPDTWTGAVETLTKYGFENDKVVNRFYRLTTSEIDFDVGKMENLYKVDPVADKDELIRVFSTEMPNQTPEQIGAIVDRWADTENPRAQNIIANIIAKDSDGKIVSHTMAIKNPNLPERAFLTHISIYDDAFMNLRTKILEIMLMKLKKKGYKEVQLIGIPEGEFDSYADYAFPEYKVTAYKRAL